MARSRSFISLLGTLQRAHNLMLNNPSSNIISPSTFSPPSSLLPPSASVASSSSSHSPPAFSKPPPLDDDPSGRPFLDFLFPGYTRASKDVVPQEYEPPGGPVTDRVYLDITIGEEKAGRVVLGLYGGFLPLTVRNFISLATGRNPDGRAYANTLIHRVAKDLFIQGGDVVNNNGTGTWSIYGQHFNDETTDFLFSRAGLLAMANFHGQPHSNGCQFFITLTPLRYLDRNAVVFGEVIQGFDVLRAVNSLELDLLDRPHPPVSVEACGVLRGAGVGGGEAGQGEGVGAAGGGGEGAAPAS